MANEAKLQDAMQSDFTAVVSDIAEELLARLNIDEDGSVISTCSKLVHLILGNYSYSLAL